MSGMFALAFGHCIACRRPFGFNPVHVPSTTAITGQREPVCEECMTAINAGRRARGLAEFTIHPEAYGPAEESELQW